MFATISQHRQYFISIAVNMYPDNELHSLLGRLCRELYIYGPALSPYCRELALSPEKKTLRLDTARA